MLSINSHCESCSIVSDSLRPHRIIQARILEWVAFPFSRECSKPRDQTLVSQLQADSLSLVALPLSHKESPINSH